MTPGEEANDDNSGNEFFFDPLDNNGNLSVLIRIASILRSNEYTQHTIS